MPDNANKRRRLSTVGTILSVNFSTWIRSPRTIIMFCFVIAVSYIRCHSQYVLFQSLERPYGLLETISCIMFNGCNMTVMSILYLVTITELPLRTNFQYSMLLRTDRKHWTLSQILYCCAMSLFMVVMLLVICTIILLLLGMSPHCTNQWCDSILIGQNMLEPSEAYVSEYIRLHFSPVQAGMLSSLILFLFWLTMTLVIVLCSINKVPTLGISIYMILLLANLIFFFEALGNIPTPIQYSTLNAIISHNSGEESAGILKTLFGYLIVVALLQIAIFKSVKRSELTFAKTTSF